MSNCTALPVDSRTDEILETIYTNIVTIITAPTGSGKSTRIPQMLLRSGSRIVVTEPRRLAARSLAEYVGLQLDGCVGLQVGYRTGFERHDSTATRLLYCTDGLQLVRELLGHNKKRDVLILDEFHERNIAQDLLLAWCRRSLEHNPWFRLVVMSATIDAARISEYFWGAPIIHIPGRMYPVTTLPAGHSLGEDIVCMLKKSKNVLVFLPGKREIYATLAYLNQTDVDAIFLPLHGELDPSEQERCFRHYNVPKCILATNIAETSITIDDIDVVIDSGLKRESLAFNEVEGLYTVPVSLAEESQRMGRAGRTKPGEYISHCPVMSRERKRYPEPEIKRRLLASVYLRVKADGRLNMQELTFLDQPARDQIPIARRTLIRLGCLDQIGEVTAIGAKVNRMPVSPQLGRMIVEAERWGVVQDVIDIAALIEAEGIVDRDNSSWRKRFAPSEQDSDVLAQLAAFQAARELLQEGQNELADLGINVRALKRAVEISDKIHQLPLLNFSQSPCRLRRRKKLLLCLCAGLVDHVYRKEGTAWNNGDGRRFLGHDSVVPRSSEYLVGIPFDVNTESDDGHEATRLIVWATRIPETLISKTLGRYGNAHRRPCRERRGRHQNLRRHRQRRQQHPGH